MVVLYGGFIAIRAAYSLHSVNCNDWNLFAGSKISLDSMTVNRPEDWQMHNCYNDSESNSKFFTLHDYQVPDVAAIVYTLGLSDGWGVFVPSNSGRIEVLEGNWIQEDSLDEIEQRYDSWPEFETRKVETSRLKVAGYNALQIVITNEPEQSIKPKWTGRYGYSKEIVIDAGSKGYALKLWNNWHKAESRDAWVAKYEPVFDHLVSTVEFK